MSQDHEPDGDPREGALASRLYAARALPSATFRGALGRRLAAEDPGYGPRPENLRTIVAIIALAAVILLALGVLQAAGRL